MYKIVGKMGRGTSVEAVEVLQRALDVLQIVQWELLLFAATWFVISAFDELAIDALWLWYRLTGRVPKSRLVADDGAQPLIGPAAVFVPAWQEAEVIGPMIRHTLDVWRHDELTLYIGLYPNDEATLTAAVQAAGSDHRVRFVVNDQPGPTTKADCLNRLYRALCEDEVRSDQRFRSLVLHDAEDMVHPDALALIDRTLGPVDFVQLPVRPEPQRASHFVGGHYSDEFAEAHAKSMVVRDILGAGIPAAGVGCGFSRNAIEVLFHQRRAQGEAGPFASECLTEDYELGLIVSRGRRSRFVRRYDRHGDLVATRAFFPSTLDAAIRQKSRWIHGISLQSWDRLGWSARPVELWMALRDRCGPLTALVLGTAYLLLAIEGALIAARLAGWESAYRMSPILKALLAISFTSFVWRALWRFHFTSREYGIIEGLRAMLRIPVSNIIAIIAGRRAVFAYARTLRGELPIWDKTDHAHHPSIVQPPPAIRAGEYAMAAE